MEKSGHCSVTLHPPNSLLCSDQKGFSVCKGEIRRGEEREQGKEMGGWGGNCEVVGGRGVFVGFTVSGSLGARIPSNPMSYS